MRRVSFIISGLLTAALIFCMSRPWGSIPALGSFLSPQQGFWQNAVINDNRDVEINNSTLKSKAAVYVDERGVPHVFANSDDDAYFVQGYLHAMDRLWQMEFQVIAARGDLSSVLGVGKDSVYLKRDRQMRRMGMGFGAKRAVEAASADPAMFRVLQSYADGINAYIDQLSPGQLPLEFKLLGQEPERWTVLHSAYMLKNMSYSLTGSSSDIERTWAKEAFSDSLFALLYPRMADSARTIIPAGTNFTSDSSLPFEPAVIPPSVQTADSMNLTDSARKNFAPNDKDNGSNNWALSGARTASGKPILCNDPHLEFTLPAIWYEMQISIKGQANTYGVSIPGAPCIALGFNDHVSWGATNAYRDVMDWYELKMRGSNENEYEMNGQWLPVHNEIEIFKIKGGGEFADTVRYTMHGPVVYDRNFTLTGGPGNQKPLAMRWSAHDPSNDFKFYYLMNRATNYADFSKALQYNANPGQNYVFACTDGDIAMYQQGAFVNKWKGQGEFIMPGWDSAYLWKNYIDYRQNLHVLNPAQGYVASANQAPVDDTYPYNSYGDYDLYRGYIINRLLKDVQAASPEDMMALQHNDYNAFAELSLKSLLPQMSDSGLNQQQQQQLALLKSWNFVSDSASQAGPVFQVWMDSLLVDVYGDELAATGINGLEMPADYTLTEAMLRDTNYVFFDDVRTPSKEGLKDIAYRSFKKAVAGLDSLHLRVVNWGHYNNTGLRHLLRLPAFSRLDLDLGGGRHIINATKRFHGPSWRLVALMTDPVQAWGIYPGGESGDPASPYYDNFVDKWAAGGYYQLWMMKSGEEKDKRIVKTMHFHS